MPPKKRRSYTHSKRGGKPRSRSTSPVPPLVSPLPPTTAASLPSIRSRSRTPPPGSLLNRGPPVPPSTIRQPRSASQTPADITPRREATKRKGISPMIEQSSPVIEEHLRQLQQQRPQQELWERIGATETEEVQVDGGSAADEASADIGSEDELESLGSWDDCSIPDDESQDEGDDLIDEALDELAQEDLIDWEVARRIAIAFIFVHVFCCPDESEWDGRNGVHAQIRKMLSIPKGASIRYVFEDITKCQTAGTKYRGRRQALGETRPVNIPNDSVEAQIVADVLEDGFSLMQATRQVNHHLKETEQPLVSFSSVWHLSKRLKPLVKPIKRLKQGSTDKESAWAQARYNWSIQLILRLGLSAKLTDKAWAHMRAQGIDGQLPKWFDGTLLIEFKIDRQDIVDDQGLREQEETGDCPYQDLVGKEWLGQEGTGKRHAIQGGSFDCRKGG
eukprot:Sro371_g128620.1 n/a (448) ;mRNA; f:56434-58025